MVPGWGMQLRARVQSWVKAATGSQVGPVKVVLAGVVQSTWNLNTFRGCSTVEEVVGRACRRQRWDRRGRRGEGAVACAELLS